MIITETRTPGQAGTAPGVEYQTNGFIQATESNISIGWALFFAPDGTGLRLDEIRDQLEVKYLAAICSTGNGGCPLHVDRIANQAFKPTIARAMLQDWTLKDLREEALRYGPARTALLATLDKPRWTGLDASAFDAVERLQYLAQLARKGGTVL